MTATASAPERPSPSFLERVPSAGGAVVVVLAAAVIWGTSFIANDAGVKAMAAPAFALYRFAIAGALALAVAAALGAWRPQVFREPGLWIIASANALGMAAQYWAQERTTPARTALFVNASVILIALLSYLLFKERLGRGKGVAAAAAFAGVALVETGGSWGLASTRLAIGDALALAAGVGVSLYVVFTKAAAGGAAQGSSWFARAGRACGRLDGYPLAAAASAIFAATAVLLLPIALVAGGGSLPPAPPAAWLPLAWTGAACTVLAYGAWMWALKRVGAATSAVILLTEVVWAALFSALLDLETLGWATLLGGALILAATAHVAREAAG